MNVDHVLGFYRPCSVSFSFRLASSISRLLKRSVLAYIQLYALLILRCALQRQTSKNMASCHGEKYETYAV